MLNQHRCRLALALLLPTWCWASAPAVAADAPVAVDRPPDSVEVVTDVATLTADAGSLDEGGVRVATAAAADGLHVRLASPRSPIKTVRLRWKGSIDPSALCLGDAWERAYGELQWKPLDPARPMPWYFLATAGDRTDGFGVMTGPASLCCWTADAEGITLTADVRCGGVGVQLGGRALDVCTVVQHRGKAGESPFDADVALCKQMCPHPRLARQPVYGFNDWYCTYGHNTAAGFVRDAGALAALAPAGANRPFMVVDDGWQASRQGGKSDGDPWDRTNAKFGSTMPDLARRVAAMSARAGLWYRPLEAWRSAPHDQLLRGTKDVFDPSVPAVRQRITADMRRFHQWGFALVKHDFSTSEITSLWGNKMGDSMVHGDWGFADRTRTTAEVIRSLYQAIRDGGGDDMVIEGCNTVGHLSAGLFELQRIGDDTSGNHFADTLRNGVNCLAFRAPQQGTFFGADADCVGLAKAGSIPWDKNRQWLDLVARSGTPLFVSWRTDLLDDDTRAGIRAAFAAAARPQPVGQPLDWTTERRPKRWMLDGHEATFDW
jgi:alpha-galactosidase